MFLGDFAERRQTEITLHNVDAASMTTLIDYAYTGTAQCAVHEVEQLYASAHFLRLDDVVAKCSKWLMSHADLSNCLHLALFADRYSDSLLMSVSDRTAAVNIVDVADTVEFLALTAEHLRRIIALDELGVRDEEEVLHVISKWMKHDYESRRKHAKVLLNVVRLRLIDLAKCEALLMELQMREWVMARVTEEAKEEGTASSRNGCQDVLLVVGGKVWISDCRNGSHYIISNESRFYDPSRDVWSTFPSLVEPRSCPGLVTVGDVLYAVGGEIIEHTTTFYNRAEMDSYLLSTVERYDSKQNRWVADVKPMSHPRPGNEITSCLGRVYGISPNRLKKNWFVETYDSEENRWFPFSSPSKPRYCVEDVIVAALSDHVYVFYHDDDEFGYIRYDPIEDRWQSFSPTPFSVHSMYERQEAPHFTVTNNDSINFYWNWALCVSFSSKSEQWCVPYFDWHSRNDYCLFGGGAGDCDNYYLLFAESMAVIDIGSQRISERKPGKNYIPKYLRHCGAKFISRNFVLNLM
ncbi:kelch-like protein 20 [Oscarella lobularis]|uniref:kelch-like protein 20 n=1 Tax=Oscarella lobularis TaxID=121494 RepID=UPI003313AEDE